MRNKTYHVYLDSNERKKPLTLSLYMFNGLRSKTLTSEVDYRFWESKSWLNSTYYYDVKVNPFKMLFGTIINRLVKLIWRRMQKKW